LDLTGRKWQEAGEDYIMRSLYASPNIIRVMKSKIFKWVVYVARMGEMTNAFRILVGIPEGKRPLGRPKHRSEDDIRLDL
jgi:hypothetical protein